MQAFAYIPVSSVDEAVAILTRESDVRILSGGTDLLVQLREGRSTASTVVDIKHIQAVNELSFDQQRGLLIGAAVPCYRIYGDPTIVSLYPGLIDAASLIGGVQIQGRASIGGNLCNASPAADSIPALIAYHAAAIIVGPTGQREVPVEDFCTAPGRTILRRGELLLALRLPVPPPGFGAAYLRFIPRNEMDIAVVGSGVSVVLDATKTSIVAARCALGAVAPRPLFVPQFGEYLAGRIISADVIAEAARIAQSTAQPITDLRGTAEQRRHLAGVLTRRALVIAIERARSLPN